MIVAKQVADLLTGLRVVLAFSFVVVGVTQGVESLPLAIWMLIVCWVTDCLDGLLARRSSRQYHTWLGDNDLGVDMVVSVGLLIYIIETGFLTVAQGVVYGLVWGVVFLRVGIPRSLGMLFQAPIYGVFLYISLQEHFYPAYWMLIFIVVMVVGTWPRFPQEVIPGFLSGMNNIFGKSSKRN
jgi:hypothetical protein